MEDTFIPFDDHNTHNGKQEFKTTFNGNPEDFTPHDRKQVTMIACSPKMKNIVTWSDEDNSVVCWHISNQQELKHKHRISLENNEGFINYDENKVYSEYTESKYSKNFGDIKNWFTVSDDKFVSMPIEKVYIKINYVSKTEEKDEMKAVSIIEEKTVTRIKIAYFLFDNSFSVDNIKLSDDGILLFAYGKKLEDNLHEDPYPCISIYSADRGIRFTTYIYDKTVNVDAVYLIAPDIGARLLIVYNKSYKKNVDNYRCSICNPFAPYIPFENYVKANDLFKDFDLEFDNNFENKHIIKYDKIVGFNKSGTLVIKDLIKDLVKDSEPNYKDWIFYLRNKLKDFNSIFISSISEQIIDLVIKSKQTAKEATFDIDKKPQYSKYFVNWTLKYEYLYKNMHIFLTAEFKNAKIESAEIKSDTIQIVPAIYITSDRDVKRFVKECDCLDNDDLVMVTALGVLIWTFNTNNNKIELVYFWDDESDSWEWNEIEVIKLFYEIDHENFDEKNFDIKKLKKKSYFLPPPSYINMMRYNYSFSQSELLTDDRLFFNELIEKHINNKFFLILYGQKLVQDIIEEDEETLLRKLFNGTPQLFLMFPFPNFVAYDDNEENDNLLKKLFKPRSSHFVNIDDLTFYSTWNCEALINFKWNTFGKKCYFAIWLIYIVFFGSFIIVATLSHYISWPCQKILLIITTVLGFWHLFIEIRNITFSHKEYFESLWNYLDLGAIISAIITSIIWLINGSVSIGAITFTALLLELKFIIYLRFIRYFGIYLAMIMNTADKVQFGSAILAAYYMMITGDSTPVSEWVSNEDIIIMALMMFFSFFILTYLMNLFIGILGNLLGDNKDNHLAYLTLKKEILEEIELFYLSSFQKKNYKWFPYTFFYSVHISEIRKLISCINSDDWEESTKPIITKITKAIKDEKQESEFNKIKKNDRKGCGNKR
ncbi:transient receptor potential cation channel subfamily a member 1-like [Gigaspora margarita]|uniref:Transient receptor potential cation channel subfamily a member 1-like n=1 Tax=Gigaspora margarita TaxID=4874 RepID=A0A8H4A442_GIGMA|nr:transient receptor potential cation channel subfamily a member 1-like [Gigaspora margarita]